MRRSIIAIVLVLTVVGVAGFYYRGNAGAGSSSSSEPGAGGAAPARGGARGGGGFGAGTVTVELATVSRADLTEKTMVVGNLIGAATVEVVPKVNGRLESISVKIGDAVKRGEIIAKVEDREIREQVKQADASYEVARASVRQREADLRFAETNLERSRNLFAKNLLPRQSLDDAQARYEAAQAQLDLTQAQFAQAKSRQEELRITLSNTEIISPVDGFVGKRNLDAGAFVGPNSPVVSVVDIHVVRLVANLVERDIQRVRNGMPADVEVDAYPGETFQGRVARIAPVLDPATRTAQMEVEVPNPAYRLKPGMYARVRFVVERREKTLAVPRVAVLDIEGKRGVFVADQQVARFHEVATGLQEGTLVEVTSGVQDGDRVVTTGAGSLKDGDPILLTGQRGGARGARGGTGRGAPGAEGFRRGRKGS